MLIADPCNRYLQIAGSLGALATQVSQNSVYKNSFGAVLATIDAVAEDLENGGDGGGAAATSNPLHEADGQQRAPAPNAPGRAGPGLAAPATIPLPHGWQAAITTDGRTYYIDTINRTTSWWLPETAVPPHAVQGTDDAMARRLQAQEYQRYGYSEEEQQQQQHAETSAANPWVERFSEQHNRAYWINTQTRQSTWTNPSTPLPLDV